MASVSKRARLGPKWKDFALKQKTARAGTAEQILDVAQDLVQTRGFNAFSYGDIGKALKISNAGLHYHFPSKADLGNSLIVRYENRFVRSLSNIDAAGGTMADRFRGFVKIYADVLAARYICLCGMLAAEFETLPQEMQSALDHFFEMAETWLEAVLEQGRRDGEFSFDEPAREVAQFAISTLEGAMILARSHGAQDRFHSAANRLTASLARPIQTRSD